MAADSLEVERKYSVEEGTPLPPLAELPGVAALAPTRFDRLEAVYFDTPGLALAAHRITLRRRIGGHDAGWHLKLPAEAGARHEISEPLGVDASAVPARLAGLVALHTRGGALVPVARVSTRRAATDLLAPGGAVLAEFSDDRVEAQAPPGTGPVQTWREWELELVTGPEDLLAAADTLLASLDVNPAELPSKLARALGDAVPRQEPAATPKRKGPAAVVLLAYLREQADALAAHDPAVRLDAPDAVHQLRVSARRMRSALATFRPFVDAEAANRLRGELSWLGKTVGQARDVEVMRDHLHALVTAEPPELVVGPVARRLEGDSSSRYRQAHDVGLVALDSERYFHLMDTLEDFLTHPPLSEKAEKKAAPAAERRLRKNVKRIRAAVERAEEAEGAGVPEHELDAALHEVRKAAKRLRYAAEAARPVLGKQAKQLAEAAEELQETLGGLQDSVVTREHLRRLAAEAEADAESAFTYGRLHALEQQRAAESRARFAEEWARFVKQW
jgi:CHAD domain-containing protein